MVCYILALVFYSLNSETQVDTELSLRKQIYNQNLSFL